MKQSEVAIFQEACGQIVRRDPKYTDDITTQNALYIELIREEMQEMLDAHAEKDIVGVADGAADLIWVVLGFCNTLGINIQPVWKEVLDSNMSKIPEDGKIIKREDGKILKPATYFKPNISKALGL